MAWAKTDQLKIGVTGWNEHSLTWTRTGNFVFTVAADVSNVFGPGTKVRWKEGGAFKYGVVGTVSVAAGVTTISLIGNTDYTMAATPTANTTAFSNTSLPIGFPAYFNYTPTITGYSANPTATSYTWRTHGRSIGIVIAEAAVGTSNATTKSYTVPANVTAVAGSNLTFSAIATIVNAGAVTIAAALINAASTIISIYATPALGPWTASGNARIGFVGPLWIDF